MLAGKPKITNLIKGPITWMAAMYIPSRLHPHHISDGNQKSCCTCEIIIRASFEVVPMASKAMLTSTPWTSCLVANPVLANIPQVNWLGGHTYKLFFNIYIIHIIYIYITLWLGFTWGFLFCALIHSINKHRTKCRSQPRSSSKYLIKLGILNGKQAALMQLDNNS